MQSYGIKYMGSKRRLLSTLTPVIMNLKPRTALDVFTGTTRVAQALRHEGVRVTTSDLTEYSRVFSEAWVTGHHRDAIMDKLEESFQNIKPASFPGWFTKTYCDVKGVKGGVVRFMTPENGMLVDAIADNIAMLNRQGYITGDERSLLTASLIIAMDKVDNTVGVHQAYLKKWCTRSLNPLQFKLLRQRKQGPRGTHLTGDVLKMQLPSADVAYIDPPYTGAAYGSNYHIWESMARWDKPKVDLRTNRRVDLCKGKAVTDWNRRDTTPDAFRCLLGKLDVGHVVISYGGSSLISLEELKSIVDESHDIEAVHALTVKENIMSKIGGNKRSQSNRVEYTLVARTRS